MKTAKKKPAAAKECDCFAQSQKILKEYNTKLVQRLVLNMATKSASMTKKVLLATEKIDSTKKLPCKDVVAAYCPFCGKEYPKT